MKLTDGGIETVLIFDRGIDLPCFAAFDLLRTAEGTAAHPRLLRALPGDRPRARAAVRALGADLALEPRLGRGARLRAGASWPAPIGARSSCMHEIRAANPDLDITVDAAIGPRGDGYVVDDVMTAEEAEAYHAVQIAALARRRHRHGAHPDLRRRGDRDRPRGAQRPACRSSSPSPSRPTAGCRAAQSLREAIERTDAEGGPDYFMVNCAHPEHFADALDGDWANRIRGLRANASRKSHAELDEAETLDTGDPADLAARYAELRARLPQLELVGGCCGTDHRHIAAIAEAINP